MAIKLDDTLVSLLSKPDTVKVLATTDEKGIPHAVAKGSIQVGDDGKLIYLELIESSRTNRNMVRSIWFNRSVAVAVVGSDGAGYQIKGRPVKAIVSGPVFRRYYEYARDGFGGVDLAAVWVIEPDEILDQTYSIRRRREDSDRPYFTHLDRLAK